MKKLFELVRQGNIGEVKRILAAKPELLNCVSGPLPKKDHGQSLLQVALKTGRLEIADYLIDSGIDIDFMEAADDDPGVRAPVLFDAITAAIDPLCISQFAKQEDISRRYELSDRALYLTGRIIAEGADVNKRSSHGLSAINWSLHRAEQIIKYPGSYPFSQEKAREQESAVLDLLIDNGADCKKWLEEGYYPEPCPGPSVKSVFFDKEDPRLGINYDAVREMRSFLQDYFAKRGGSAAV